MSFESVNYIKIKQSCETPVSVECELLVPFSSSFTICECSPVASPQLATGRQTGASSGYSYSGNHTGVYGEVFFLNTKIQPKEKRKY